MKLQFRTDKPDSAVPRHLSIRFVGKFWDALRDSSTEPRIRVYPIKGYREALEVSPESLGGFNERLSELRRVLDERVIREEPPFVPYADATRPFNAHLCHISFRNGKGISYLTQFNIEPSIINNEGLAFIFQGITENGKYFILAEFPVQIHLLPASFDERSFNGYDLPESFYEVGKVKKNELEYKRYISKTVALLNQTHSTDYSPDLGFFENLMKTLEIR